MPGIAADEGEGALVKDKPVEAGSSLAKRFDRAFQVGETEAIPSLPDGSGFVGVAAASAAVRVTASGISPEDCGSEFFRAAILASASAICWRADSMIASSPLSLAPSGVESRTR